jgi:16S rRNA (cytosine967-C5)-methyltransferase
MSFPAIPMNDAGQTPKSAAFSSGVNPRNCIDKPREKALKILRRVEDGAFADPLLEQARPGFKALDNAFILELVYGTLRNRALLDWTLNQFSSRPLIKTDAWTRNILRLGAYQILFLNRVPVSAAVNTSTELAKEHGKKQGYVNGLLRNLDRNRSSITYPGDDDPLKRLSVLYSHPDWLIRRWVERFGPETAEAVLRANNTHAPLILRTNTLKTTREELKSSLESLNITVSETKYSPAGLEIGRSPGIATLPAYQEGLFMVQDQAAQLVGMMLEPRPGERVLDACAAPGGKATHLAEIMKNRGTVVALESDPARIQKIHENILRLGTTIISPVLGDAAHYQEGTFDKVLVDAPCSGLGVLRRHPDGRWNKTESTPKDRQVLQKQILENCARLLRPGGALVYATCSTEPEENEDVIAGFLGKAGKEFSLDDPRSYLPPSAASLVDESRYFRTFPREPEMDGFFGVRMVRAG